MLQREQYALSGGSLSKLTDFASFLVYEFQAKPRPACWFLFTETQTDSYTEGTRACTDTYARVKLPYFVFTDEKDILLSTLNCIPMEKHQNKSNLTGKRKREEETGTETSVRSPHMYDLPCPHNKAKQNPIS